MTNTLTPRTEALVQISEGGYEYAPLDMLLLHARQLEQENAEYLSIIHWKAADNLKLHDLICDLWREIAQLKAAQNISQEPVALSIHNDGLLWVDFHTKGQDASLCLQVIAEDRPKMTNRIMLEAISEYLAGTKAAPQPSVDATLENARIAEAVRQACLEAAQTGYKAELGYELCYGIKAIQALDLTTILKDQ